MLGISFSYGQLVPTAPAIVNALPVLLFYKTAVNFNSTADQLLNLGNTFSSYIIRRIVVKNGSASLTTAAGGVYDAASKGGNAIVTAAQVYTAVTGATKYVDCTLAALVASTVLTSQTVYLSLTLAQGSAATGDIYIFGEAFQ